MGKNFFLTGILAVAKPFSIIVEVKELFGSESKSQVYAHLHELLLKPTVKDIGDVATMERHLLEHNF